MKLRDGERVAGTRGSNKQARVCWPPGRITSLHSGLRPSALLGEDEEDDEGDLKIGGAAPPRWRNSPAEGRVI